MQCCNKTYWFMVIAVLGGITLSFNAAFGERAKAEGVVKVEEPELFPP